MKNSVTPFTRLYAQWLDSFRSMLPGWVAEPKDPSHSRALISANEEWEDEGGSVRPAEAAPDAAPAPKIPF